MAIGKQSAPAQVLLTAALWLRREGFLVREMHGLGPVHRVHAAGSWHYDQEGGVGKAFDANWPNAKQERAKILAVLPELQRLGLAVIFAKTKPDGSITRPHNNHLHADVGSYSYLGPLNLRRAVQPGGDVTTAALQRAVHLKADQVWGDNTEGRLGLVRSAARGSLPQTGAGREALQRAVGTKVDGVWGPNSRKALVATVKEIQQALRLRGYYKGKVDGIWGDGTDRAYRAVRNVRYRR